MAARVVWLVATGRVAPGEMLGLTFTTKATAELADPDPRAASGGAGLLPGARPAPGAADGERGRGRGADGRDVPLLRLRPAHRARPPDRPRARHPADRRRLRYQLAARTMQRHTAPVEHLSDAPQPRRAVAARPRRRAVASTSSTPDEVRALDAARAAALRRGDGGREPQDLPRAQREGDPRHRPAGRAARPGRGATARLKRHHGLMDFSDQIALTARLAARLPRGRRGRAGEVQGGAPRRVPGHLGRPGADAEPALQRPRRRARARAPGHRGRRPQPGDLRLARRVGLQHPRVRRRPSRRSAAAPRRTP